MMNLQQKTFLLVTGASRGIGQTMAIEISRKVQAQGSIVVLMGRNNADLAATKKSIQQLVPSIKVYTHSLELSTAKATDFADVLQNSLESLTAKDFERAIIIHNAGTVGDITQYARNVNDTAVWSDYFHTNLFSAISLNCEFMRVFETLPKIVVNLSTKCAVEPFASMSYYCTSKAARDMYFRVLAVEEAPERTLVLNYAPGAIDTQMSLQVQQQTHNAELAAAFRQQRESKSMLTSAQTTEKFISLLEQQKFKSGDHVDYWD